MHIYTLIPRDRHLASAEFLAGDAGHVLGFVHRLGWDAADVKEDGEYLYSLSLNREGIWSLTHRLP